MMRVHSLCGSPIRGCSRRYSAVLFAVCLSSGCIERTISISTEPQGATVFLNDQEVGLSPVRVPFTWYGDYDIIIRKPGYRTIRTHQRLHAPWYQLPGIDLFTECLVPFTVRDDREVPTFVLEERVDPSMEDLLLNAEEMAQSANAGG